MTLLFDENVSYRIVKKIKEVFPESLHVSEVRPMLKSDLSIFNYAKQNNMSIVTFDEDFRDLQVVYNFLLKLSGLEWAILPR